MKSIEEMTVQELETYIAQFPNKSACDRAMIERLKQVLEAKILNNPPMELTDGYS